MDILNIADAKCFQHNMRSGWEQAQSGEANIERLRDLSSPWTRENALIFAGYVAGVFAFQTGQSMPTLGELVDISAGEKHFARLDVAREAGRKFGANGKGSIFAEARKRYPNPGGTSREERAFFTDAAFDARI